MTPSKPDDETRRQEHDERVTFSWQLLNELGLGRGVTPSSVQRRLRVNYPDAKRLLDLREVLMEALAASEPTALALLAQPPTGTPAEPKTCAGHELTPDLVRDCVRGCLEPFRRDLLSDAQVESIVRGVHQSCLVAPFIPPSPAGSRVTPAELKTEVDAWQQEHDRLVNAHFEAIWSAIRYHAGKTAESEVENDEDVQRTLQEMVTHERAAQPTADAAGSRPPEPPTGREP